MDLNKIFDEDLDNVEKNILGIVNNSVNEAREMQKKKVAENVQIVIDALKKIEQNIKEKYDFVGGQLEKRIVSIKDGRDGINGRDGKDGKDGKQGKDGRPGRDGKDGKNGLDGQNGEDGVSVVNAHIDFDGSLIISLSSGNEINVGEVVAPALAEQIKVITNGGGTSQSVLDTLTSLQSQIDTLSGATIYKGLWNASTNSPALTSSVGTSGNFYIVSVAGSTSLDGITNWGVGDWAIFNGTVWQRVEGGAEGNFTTLSATGKVSASTAAGIGGFSLGRRDTGATAWEWYSAAGALQLFSQAAVADVFTIAANTAANTISISSTGLAVTGSGTSTYSDGATYTLGILSGGASIARIGGTAGTTSLELMVNGSVISTHSLTGLAVTGAISATTTGAIGSGSPLGTQFDVFKSNAGTPVDVGIFNSDNTNGSSSANLRIYTGGASGGDPIVNWEINGVTRYYMGIDNSNSDKLVIGSGYTPGAADYLTIDSSGLAVTGAISSTGNLAAVNALLTGGTITTGSTTALSLATSGGTQAKFNNTAATVNWHNFFGAPTGNNAIVIAAGEANVGYDIATKGTGAFRVFTGATTDSAGGAIQQVSITHTASANRYITLTGSNGGNPTIGTSAGSLAVSTSLAVTSSGGYLSFTGTSGGKYIGQADAIVTGAASTDLGISAGNNLVIATGGTTERMRIDSSGYVTVNGDPSALGFGAQQFNSVGNSGTSAALFTEASGSNAAVVLMASASTTGYTANMLDIRTAMASGTGFRAIQYASDTNTGRFYVLGNGDVQNTNNSYGAISDVRLKENIVDASPKLSDLMQVRVRNYNIIGDTQKQLGVVAQELESIFPAMIQETVDRDENGDDLGTTTKSVKYSVFVPILVKAIQELKAEFDAYKAAHP